MLKYCVKSFSVQYFLDFRMSFIEKSKGLCLFDQPTINGLSRLNGRRYNEVQNERHFFLNVCFFRSSLIPPTASTHFIRRANRPDVSLSDEEKHDAHTEAMNWSWGFLG